MQSGIICLSVCLSVCLIACSFCVTVKLIGACTRRCLSLEVWRDQDRGRPLLWSCVTWSRHPTISWVSCIISNKLLRLAEVCAFLSISPSEHSLETVLYFPWNDELSISRFLWTEMSASAFQLCTVMCVSQISDYNSCIRSRDYVHLCIVQQQRHFYLLQVQLLSKASPSQHWQCSEIVLLGHVLLAAMTATHKNMDSAILVGK